MANGKKGFLARAFEDMKRSAAEQHELDRAQFEAAKAESKAVWEEAKMSPEARAEKRRAEINGQIEAANQRTAEANARAEAAKKSRK